MPSPCATCSWQYPEPCSLPPFGGGSLTFLTPIRCPVDEIFSGMSDASLALKLFSSFAVTSSGTVDGSGKVASSQSDSSGDDIEAEFSHDDFDDDESIYVVRGPVLPGEIERFREYARRVRSIDFQGDYAREPRNAVLAYFTAVNQGPLFPLLEKIHWARGSFRDIGILSLCSPSVLQISFYYSGRLSVRPRYLATEDYALMTLLHAVFSACSNLEIFLMNNHFFFDPAILAPSYPLCPTWSVSPSRPISTTWTAKLPRALSLWKSC